jgi:hypothetical protein
VVSCSVAATGVGGWGLITAATCGVPFRLDAPLKTSHKRRSQILGGTVLAVALVLVGAFVLHSGSTRLWPEAHCVVAGSRVIRADVADSFRAIVLYKGEYQLRYSVDGRDYYVWVSSGWADPDKEFVRSKVDYLPETCDFRVRYNPLHPSDAIAIRK